MKKIGAVILAAGRGSRMNSKSKNKVVFPLDNKPMILYTIDLLRKTNLKPIIIVVGFAKKSVMDIVRGSNIVFALQRKRLGTAHALICALHKLPDSLTDVVVLQGDDSVFYTSEIIQKLIDIHTVFNSSVTLLTLEVENPFGLGRIIRDQFEKITSIVEEKDAGFSQRKIKEINPACYIFKIAFLKKYLKKIKKNRITGEYYLVELIRLAVLNNERIETVRLGEFPWRGVNTKSELKEAENLLIKSKTV